MLVGSRTKYEVRRIPCLLACMSGVGGEVQRCTQERWECAWESRHAYLGEHEVSTGSLSLV